MNQRLGKRTVQLLVLLVAVFVAAGCLSPDEEVREPLTTETLAGEYTTFDGETVSLETFTGQDVVLWFWAPW